MKKLILIALAVVAMACSKEEPTPQPNNQTIDPAILGQWELTQIEQANGDISLFEELWEFTDSHRIIVTTPDTVEIYKYTANGSVMLMHGQTNTYWIGDDKELRIETPRMDVFRLRR